MAEKTIRIPKPPEGADPTAYLLGVVIERLEALQRSVETGANKVTSAVSQLALAQRQPPQWQPMPPFGLPQQPAWPAWGPYPARYQQMPVQQPPGAPQWPQAVPQHPAPGDCQHGVPHAPVRCGWCKLFKNARCSIGSSPALGGPAAGECASFTESEACARIRSADRYLEMLRTDDALGADARRVIDGALDRLRGVA